MSIKRYIIRVDTRNDMTAHHVSPDGGWVRYLDHVAEVERLQEKALRFDLDQAGITQREAEAVELVELRAEVERLTEANRLWYDNNQDHSDWSAVILTILRHRDEARAELERLRRYDEMLTKVMPPDFKDWHQNSREEWPLVAALTIDNRTAQSNWAHEELSKAQAEVERLTNKLNENSQNFEIECQKAEIERLTLELDRVTRGTYSLELARLSKRCNDAEAEVQRLHEHSSELNSELLDVRIKHVGEKDELRQEVERLNQHRDELAADKHRLLLEIRALDDAFEQLKQRNRELEAEVANWRHVMEDA